MAALNNWREHMTNEVESAQKVYNVPPPFLRVGFAEVGSGLVGGAADELTLVQTGPGMTVSQTGGNLTIATGVTANSETIIRSKDALTGSLMARVKTILSQRIVNQTFRVELADVIGENLSFVINSATSVTVTFDRNNPFTAANVGQSLRLSAIVGAAGIPGRYAIASVSGQSVTFTVASWPASGSGTLTLYGWNYINLEYSGATATSANVDAQRRGWASGATTATINTTASPGHVVQVSYDVHTVGFADALVASATTFQWTQRATRIENVPDPDVQLHLFLIVQNGSTAPASTTTWTLGFLQVEDQGRAKFRIASADPSTAHPLPVQMSGGTLTSLPALAAGTALAGDVGVQYRATASGLATTNTHFVAAGSTNATSVKGSAGKVFGWYFANTTAAWRYVKLHNIATAPTAGTGVVRTIGIPPNSIARFYSEGGITFATGIGLTMVTGAADADATAVTANDIVGELFYA
jgi:hypothetical protein